jgi:hypothetical protein
MKNFRPRISAASIGFIATLSIGFAAPSVAEDPNSPSVVDPFKTEIEQQIEAGNRQPVLTRETGGSQVIKDQDVERVDSTKVTSGDAMVMTLDQRITNHTEVLSLRSDLSSEISNRFSEDVILNQRIDNLLGTVSNQGNAITLNSADLTGLRNDVNTAQGTANSAFSLATTANAAAVNAQTTANSASSLASNVQNIASLNDNRISALEDATGPAGNGPTRIVTNKHITSRIVQKCRRGKDGRCWGYNNYMYTYEKTARESFIGDVCVSRQVVKRERIARSRYDMKTVGFPYQC